MPTPIDGRDVNQLCEAMLQRYGEDAQLNQAIQELAELIQAITKIIQKKSRITNIYGKHGLVDEMADVWLMLRQLETIYDCSDTLIDYKFSKIANAQKLLRKGVEK